MKTIIKYFKKTFHQCTNVTSTFSGYVSNRYMNIINTCKTCEKTFQTYKRCNREGNDFNK